MFHLKYIGILFLLMACGDNTYNKRTSRYPSPYGTSNIARGASAGVATLSSSTASNVNQMQMQIFGTGGRSALAYNGTAQFTGTITFSGNYSSNYSNYNTNIYQPPTPHYPSAYPGHSPQQRCPAGPVQFTCQGTLSSGHFKCPNASIYGSAYTISGVLGSGRTTAENYEMISVTVIGLCTTPRV